MRKRLFLLTAALILFSLCSNADRIYQTSLSVDPTYMVSETVSVVGSLFWYNTTNGTASETQAESGVTVNVSLLNANQTTVLENTTAITNSVGVFAANLTAPETPGTYTVRAQYSYNGTVWEGSASFKVLSTTVDNIYILPNKATYYASESMAVTVRAVRDLGGGTEAGVENYTINTTLRDSNSTVLQSFACTTDAAGYCNGTLSAPTSVGTYSLEANDYIGYTTISVIPFDVSLTLLDDTGTTIKTVYLPGDLGKIRVRVSYNGTVPGTGTFTFNGTINAANGSVIKTINETTVNTSTYTSFHDFTVDGNFTVGSYTIHMDVTQASGEAVSLSVAAGENTISSSMFFKVQDWSITVEKVSGFDHDLVAFSGANLTFKVTVNNLTNGTPVTNLNNTHFNILFYSNKLLLSSHNVTQNDTHYLISLTAPASGGTYRLEVNATINSITQSEERSIMVVDSIAYATPANAKGELREMFDGNEYVYVQVGLKNKTHDLNVTDVTISSVRDDEGNTISYTQNSNWSADNESVREWRYNITNDTATKALLKLDNPKSGGLYFIEISVNNGSGIATTKLIIAPYNIMAFPHGKDDTWGWRWDFGKTDTIYFNLTVVQAQHQYGSAMMMFESDMYGGMGGMYSGGYTSPAQGGGGTGDMYGGASQNAVSGATINVSKLINDQTFEEVSLSHINWSCTKTNSNGQATCTLAPLPTLAGSAVPMQSTHSIAEGESSANWTSGRYHVIFTVTGEDNTTSDVGHSGFEVRSFYINAMSDNWMNKPTDNLTFNVYMYDPGDTMFWGYYYGGGSASNGTGLFDGRIDVVKILYHGSPGSWIWPPSVYNYTGTLPANKSITNSVGNFTLSAPTGGWKTGSYTAVLKGYKTDSNGTVVDSDYGEAWFEIRLWDVYANPTSVNGTCYQWASSFSSKDNVTLYINIHNAGSWSSGEEIINGPVTIGVKSIMDHSSWPPSELTEGEDYTANTITVNESSPDMWSSCSGGGYAPPLGVVEANASDYLLNIVPVGGTWKPGYYNVVLDVNGTDTGWGYFNVISFNAQAQFVSANGSSIWSSKGDGPVYFNVSSSQDYFSMEPLNTTIQSISLMTWAEGGWTPTEYKYPGDLTLSTTSIPGSAIVAINLTNASSWPSGNYNGQMVLEDDEGNTAMAWVWFEVRAFVVSAYTNTWETGTNSTVNVTLSVLDPQDWSTEISGTYNITGIYEETYGYMGPPTRTEIVNYTPTSFTQGNNTTTTTSTTTSTTTTIPWGGENCSNNCSLCYNSDNCTMSETGCAWNISSETCYDNGGGACDSDCSQCYSDFECNNSLAGCNWTGSICTDSGSPSPQYTSGEGTSLLIYPNAGRWSSGYHNLIIDLADQDSSTGNAWISFNVVPFAVTVSGQQWSYRSTQNITLNITVHEPGDTSNTVTANISQIWEEDYSNCWTWPCPTLQYNFTPAQIEGNGTLTITPPSGGWSSNWHSLTLRFTDPTDSTSYVDTWLSFDSRPFSVYMSTSSYYYKKNENVTVDVTVQDPSDWSDALANVTRVYSQDWSTWPPTETNYTFTPGQIDGSGNLTIIAPDGGWDAEYHNLQVVFSEPTAAASTVEEGIWFEIRSYSGSCYPRWYSNQPNNSVDLIVYAYEPDWSTYSLVNVTGVQTNFNWEGYTDANWTLANYSSGAGNYEVLSGRQINGSGAIKLYPPAGNWNTGYYNVNIYVTNPSDADDNATFYAYFDVYSTETTTTIMNTTTTIENTTTTIESTSTTTTTIESTTTTTTITGTTTTSTTTTIETTTEPTVSVQDPNGGENVSGVINVTAVTNDTQGIIQTVAFFYINQTHPSEQHSIDYPWWNNTPQNEIFSVTWDTSGVSDGEYKIYAEAYNRSDYSGGSTYGRIANDTSDGWFTVNNTGGLSALGELCVYSSSCASGFCRDSYCCNESCTTPCYSCATGTLGYCTQVTSQDDDPECTDYNTCDASGYCVPK